MDLQLTGKTALITGSYRGTGSAIASGLIQEGATVIVHGFEEEPTRTAAEKIGTPYFVIGDITTDKGAQQVAEQAYSSTEGLDILVNNYGTGGPGLWQTTSTKDWLNIYQKEDTACFCWGAPRMLHRRRQKG